MSTQQSAVTLSAANFARQSAAFRTFKTGVPGVKFCAKAGAFKASVVGGNGPVKLGIFETLDEAVTAVSSAYAMGGL